MSQDLHPEEQRRSPRLLVPVGVSVSLRLASKQSVFVNLRNVSEKGACVVRQGSLDINEDDNVVILVLEYDSAAKITLPCKVCWVRNTGFNTYVGLSFVNSTLSQDALTRLIA
ncbi:MULTISPECIES: PilZ domain-containing protein [unclassified Cyanobium]|uniref:PilZ domain-containing protein n=1 Tax=unclassified Cyanobium TaxID=2627006 RepID=UPI0020CCB6D9|nr:MULTISPECIES: PilZ domain-containing protein [unclassified Cyanobium]MCP9835598.1 PilZ domain-containing protein [Cyanobium sp. La Preciosa 7G6]MCP9938321.1 PilZ domain-containing protein [Cyanobium sp. Aljojuca 7A6]